MQYANQKWHNFCLQNLHIIRQNTPVIPSLKVSLYMDVWETNCQESRFFTCKLLPCCKLTWQWKITVLCRKYIFTWPSFASMSFGNNGIKYLHWAAFTSSSAGFLGFTMSLRVSLVSLLQASVVSAWYKHRMCSHSFSTLYAAELLVVEWQQIVQGLPSFKSFSEISSNLFSLGCTDNSLFQALLASIQLQLL